MKPLTTRVYTFSNLIEVGFDSEAGDPLGGFCLDENDFTDLTGILMEIANEFAERRIVSVMEGGYTLDGLARMVMAHVARLAE